MTDKRKLALFDNLISCITELMWEEDKETIKEKFLDLGFTLEEYQEEIALCEED